MVQASLSRIKELPFLPTKGQGNVLKGHTTLRRVPQRRRRHRTLWPEQDRERRERRREAGTAGAIGGLARGSPDGVAELETRLCALPLGPS